MDKIQMIKELSYIKLELNRMGRQLDEIHNMVRAIVLSESKATLEPLSVSSLDGLNIHSDPVGRVLSTLPEWATKTFVAVKELGVKGIPPTATRVAALTKKKRNTESSRLAFLASLGLLQRKRKGRYVLYIPESWRGEA